MKRFSKYSIVILIIISCTLILSANSSVLNSKNYTFIHDTNRDNSNKIVQQLDNVLKTSSVFVYVSGCHLDREALPAYQALSKKYRDAKFVQITQLGPTKDYMLKNYGSFGAPKLYYIHKGDILSAMPYYYAKGKFQGWPASINRWAATLWPIAKQLNRYKNIHGVSSHNYRSLMSNKKVVLLRTDIYQPSFKEAMTSLFAAAGKYPHITFAVDTGKIGYDQEFTFKFRTVMASFSVVDNCDVVKSKFRTPYKGKIDRSKLYSWISSNYNSNSNKSADYIERDGTYLKKLFQTNNSYELATMNPQEFKNINTKYKVVSSMPMQQTFYVFVNAISDSRRNDETAKLLIKELRYDSKGGIKKAVPSPILREKVYVVVIDRLISYEMNREIKTDLENLRKYYLK